MKKTIPGLGKLKKERLEKIISLRKRKNGIYKMEVKEDFKRFSFLFKKFIVNSIGVIAFLGKLLYSLSKLFIGYLILAGLKIDRILFNKK